MELGNGRKRLSGPELAKSSQILPEAKSLKSREIVCSSWVSRQILLYLVPILSGAITSAVLSQNTDPPISEGILRNVYEGNAQSFLRFQALFPFLDIKIAGMYIHSYSNAQSFNDLTF